MRPRTTGKATEPIEVTSIDGFNTVSYNNKHNEKKEGNAMTTIVKKKQLKFEDGYLTYEGTIVSPGFVTDYILVDDFLQRAQYDNSLPEPVEKYQRKSAFADASLIEVPEPKTPAMDAKSEEIDTLAKEQELIRKRETIKNFLESNNSLVEFVCSKNVVLHDEDYHSVLIDTPILGNPLTLTKEKLLELICDAVKYPLA